MDQKNRKSKIEKSHSCNIHIYNFHASFFFNPPPYIYIPIQSPDLPAICCDNNMHASSCWPGIPPRPRACMLASNSLTHATIIPARDSKQGVFLSFLLPALTAVARDPHGFCVDVPGTAPRQPLQCRCMARVVAKRGTRLQVLKKFRARSTLHGEL